MKIYDSRARNLEEIGPAGPEVTVYACGITPYLGTHLGHVFTFVAADSLVRRLEAVGHSVRYVQNVTDIDDPILREAKRLGEDWREVGKATAARYMQEMEILNLRPPDEIVWATEMIFDMHRLIERLLEKRVAYVSGGGVYFDVQARPGYGSLSGVSPERMLEVANENGNDPHDPRKRHPLDFPLWSPHQNDEPSWESPWGPGRPGWHVGCATIVESRARIPVDVHLGGADLIFPHHEGGLAVAESAIDHRPFARHWMHTGLVCLDGEKMSKSKRNLVALSSLLARWSPEAVRAYVLSHPYRASWGHNPGDLDRAAETVQVIRAALSDHARSDGNQAIDPGRFRESFERSLDADLDTSAALQSVVMLAGAVCEGAKVGKPVGAARDAVADMAHALGFRRDPTRPDAEVHEGWRRHLARIPEATSP